MAPPPDNIYSLDIDFVALALQYPDFAKKLKPNRQLDFTDPDSVRQLTLALAHRDFSLHLHLPLNRLTPPLPNRHTYILHLHRLLDSTPPDIQSMSPFDNTYDARRQVLGIDIGTGASCIYPLLACRMRDGWRMVCTEIDRESRGWAEKNIAANGLRERVRVVPCDATSRTIIPVREVERFERIDFLMTNPPFYASQAQMDASAKAKARPPNSACTGAPVEMIYPYPPPQTSDTTSNTKPNATNTATTGEVTFLTQLLHESQTPTLRTRITWYTSLLGHLSSLTHLITLLHSHNCTNYCVWEFKQGSKTRRWGIAWSWRGLRPSVEVARGVPGLAGRYLPFPSEMVFDVELEGVGVGVGRGGGEGRERDRAREEGKERAMRALGDKVDEIMYSLEDEEVEEGMQWRWKEDAMQGVGISRRGDCWSRKARRKKAGKSKGDEVMRDDDGGEEEEEQEEPRIVIKISLRKKEGTMDMAKESERAGAESAIVHVRWLQGRDTVLFESFCGWLKRKLTS